MKLQVISISAIEGRGAIRAVNESGFPQARPSSAQHKTSRAQTSSFAHLVKQAELKQCGV